MVGMVIGRAVRDHQVRAEQANQPDHLLSGRQRRLQLTVRLIEHVIRRSNHCPGRSGFGAASLDEWFSPRLMMPLATVAEADELHLKSGSTPQRRRAAGFDV